MPQGRDKINKILSFDIRLALFLLCIATFLCYANVLTGEFQFDDRYTIIENDFIKKLDNFLHADWAQLFLSGGRPVTDLTFALNYHFGRLDVFGYHLVNLLIHLAVVILVFIFLRKTIRLAGESFRDAEILALTAAAIFALHPVQTQAVNYISQRAESLSAMFYLVSLLFFIRSIETEDGFLKKILFYGGGLISFAFSYGSKGTAISLPVILLLYDYCFLKRRPLIKRLKDSGLLIIGGAIIAVIFLIRTGSSPYVGFSIETISPYSYLLTQMRVLLTYIRLIILPVNQNLDYDYPVYNSFFEPNVFLSFLLLLFIIGTGVYLLFRSRISHPEPKAKGLRDSSAMPQNDRERRNDIKGPTRYTLHPTRLIAFGIFWFFIVLLPTSIVPLRDVIFEHRLYIASLGLILSLIITGKTFLNRALEKYNVDKGKRHAISLIMVIAILSMLAFAVNRRNAVWQNVLTLQRDVVSKSPGKPRAHSNLGTALLARGNLVEALSEFRKALECKDDGSIIRTRILINTGVTLLRMDRTGEAIEVFREGLKLDSANSDLLDNLAAALKKEGRYDEAIRYAKLSLTINPENRGAYELIGGIYYKQGDYERALEHYINASRLNTDDPVIYWNIALTLEKLGRFKEASVYMKRYLSVKTDKTR